MAEPVDAFEEPSSRAAREGATPMVLQVLAQLARRLPFAAGAGDVVAAVATRYGRHRGSVLAAGFAYYAMLAVVPSAIAIGSLAAWFGDPEALSASLDRAVARVPSLQGPTEDVLNALIDVVKQTSSTAFGITTLVSTLLAVYASSRVLVTITAILDLAYNRPWRDRSWLVRVIATLITLAFLVVFVVGLVALQSLPSLLEAFGVGDGVAGTLRWITIPLALALGYAVFSFAYRVGSPPTIEVGWLNRGGAVAMVIAVLGTIGTSIYLSFSSTLGAAVTVLGGTVVLLLWLYFLGIALVVGAEVEAVLTRASDATG